MTEAQLHKNCVGILRRRAWLYLKLTTYHAYGRSGWPDVMAISPGGKIVFFEWKLPGKEPTERQQHNHEELIRYGQTVLVIHSTDELKIALAHMEEN